MFLKTQSLEALSKKLIQGLPLSRHRHDDGRAQRIVNVKDLDTLYVDGTLDSERINEKSNFSQQTLVAGDVIIAIRGSIMKSAVITPKSAGSLAGQNVAILQLSDHNFALPGYLAAILRSQYMTALVSRSYGRSSIGLKSLRISDLKKIQIPLPSLEVQKTIVDAYVLQEENKTSIIESIKIRDQLIENIFIKLLESK